MKNLLIVFIVLLFLLTLLSSFGGSIRTTEPFYDATPAYTPETFELPNPPTYETYTNTNNNTMNNEYFYQETGPEVPTYNTYNETSEPVQQDYVPPSQESFEPLPMEKFDVPEPFTDTETTVGAPF